MHALLLAHHSDEISVLKLILQQVGFSLQVNSDLEQAANDWPELSCDLVLLAPRRELPASFVRQLRARLAVPIIVISELLTEDTQVNLLDAGVDLMIFRPYSARVLIAQIRALLRRSTGVPFFSLPSISSGELLLDPSTRTVQTTDEATHRLTQLEFRLLYTLITHPNQVFPAETLVENVWGYSGRGDRDLVRGLVRRVRSKIEPNPRQPQYIVTVPRVGYVFHADP